jgi:hypothetical protein
MPKQKLKEIRANRIVLEGLDGRPKATLDASHDDLMFIQLHGSGQASLNLDIDSDGNPKLSFCNKSGHTVLGFGISDQVGQGLTIYDSEGLPVCWIFVGPDGIPRISLVEVVAKTKARRLWSSPVPKKRKTKAA